MEGRAVAHSEDRCWWGTGRVPPRALPGHI